MALNVSAQGYVLRQGQVVRAGPSAELVNSGLIVRLSVTGQRPHRTLAADGRLRHLTARR